MNLFPYQVVHTVNNKKAAIYVIEFTGSQPDRESYRQFVSRVRAIPKPYNGHFNNSPALRFKEDASGSIAFHALPDDGMLKWLFGCKPDAHVVGTALADLYRDTFGDTWVYQSSPAPDQKLQPEDISSEGRTSHLDELENILDNTEQKSKKRVGESLPVSEQNTLQQMVSSEGGGTHPEPKVHPASSKGNMAIDSAQDPDDKGESGALQPYEPTSSPSVPVVKEVMRDAASPTTNDDLIAYFNKKMPQWMAQVKAGLIPDVFIEIAERTIGIFASEHEFINQTNMIATETSMKWLHGDNVKGMVNWIYFQLNPPRELLDMQSNVEDLKLQRLTTEQLRCLLNLAVEMKLTKTQFYQQTVELFPNVTPGHLKVDLLLNRCSMWSWNYVKRFNNQST